ncbi:hypothetical protein J2W39_003477 [Variovorax paradoxus]|uniref:Uncharacterized protein n=1 Tax=Variovorax paradoxus TaxID=34073 RepID=A0AAW8EIG3_VARPD|nr:hypothetical protein [Variovorax paradoxus]MDP9972235.1 hypothetical protein [Variovorax paradoxus]
MRKTCTIGVPTHHKVGPRQNGLGVEWLQKRGVHGVGIYQAITLGQT